MKAAWVHGRWSDEPAVLVQDIALANARLETALRLQLRALTSEISGRGDRRITDAEKRAIGFLSEALEVRRSLPDTVRELILGSYLAAVRSS
jgi:hypothetical protein